MKLDVVVEETVNLLGTKSLLLHIRVTDAHTVVNSIPIRRLHVGMLDVWVNVLRPVLMHVCLHV